MSAGDDQRRDPGAEGSDAPEEQEAGLDQAPGKSSAVAPGHNPGHAAGHNANGVPRWRQIEIMRERQALREMLDDIDADDLEFEDEVFGSEEEREAYYRAAGADLEDGGEEQPEFEDEDDFDEEDQ